MKTIITLVKRVTLCGIILSGLMLWSCGSDSSTTGDETQAQDTVSTDTTDFVAEAKKMIEEFPSPFAVTDLLNSAGASYIIDLSNKPETAEKYITMTARALNLGIYSADLSYAVTYNKKQETKNYLKASQILLTNLEIKTGYNDAFMKRIDANISNKDSLKNMFYNQFGMTYDELSTTERTNVSALMLAGATVEGVYVASQLTSMATGDNSGLKKVIAQQKESVVKLLALLTLYKDDAEIQAVSTKVAELKTIYDGVTGETLTDEQFKAISAKSEEIRNLWIKP